MAANCEIYNPICHEKVGLLYNIGRDINGMTLEVPLLE